MPKTTKKPAKRGRPSLPPGEGKRYPLNLRTTKETRELLESASRASGRSLSQELEFRLEQSFLGDDTKYADFGGEHHYRFFRLQADAAQVVGARSGCDFFDEAETYKQASIAAGIFWGVFRPGPKIGVGVGVSVPANQSVGFPQFLIKQGAMAAAKVLQSYVDELDDATDAKSLRAEIRDALEIVAGPATQLKSPRAKKKSVD